MPLAPDRMTALLNAFRRLPETHLPEPTFLEITGYQYQELLSSNILAFYLDPGKPHGLGSLLLHTLLNFVGHTDIEDIAQAEVRTEVYTEQGKRIDLVIDAGSVVVGIENKINHDVINPFEEYQRHLKQLSGDRPWYGILLTLRPVSPSAAYSRFQPLTYSVFLQALLEKLGTRLMTAREPYLTFLRDFIRTITAMTRETSMDATTLAYFRDHQSELEQLLEGVDQLRTEMRQKLQSLKSLIDMRASAFPITQGYWRTSTLLSDVLVYELDVHADLKVSIIVHLKPTGWLINLANARGDKPQHRKALEQFLEERTIAVRPRHYPHVWRLAYGRDDVPYDAPLTEVQQEVQELLRQLSDHSQETSLS